MNAMQSVDLGTETDGSEVIIMKFYVYYFWYSEGRQGRWFKSLGQKGWEWTLMAPIYVSVLCIYFVVIQSINLVACELASQDTWFNDFKSYFMEKIRGLIIKDITVEKIKGILKPSGG